MAAKSKIEWTEYTANPIKVKGGKVWPHGYHCTKVSPGCAHCYAEKLNMMRGTGQPFNDRKVEFYLDLSVFDNLPKKPCRVFVQSMGDLFHEDVPDNFIRECFDTMKEPLSTFHNFLLLTKRPERVMKFWSWVRREWGYNLWPDHIWLGVTAENQKTADERIPILLQIPAAKRFVSLEPMLGQVDLWHIPKAPGDPDNPPEPYIASLDWVIIGAESGANRRYMDMFWAIDTVKQCKAAGVPVFVKQIHLLYKKSRKKYGTILSKNMDDWPEDLRIRKWPN